MAFAILALLAVPLIHISQVSAQDANFGIENVQTGLGNSLQQGDPRTIVAKIINFALGFLGVIAVALILFGGFKWMTAAGNEEKVTEAKKLLGAGIIGLVIILAAWAIASFIINAIYQTTQGA